LKGAQKTFKKEQRQALFCVKQAIFCQKDLIFNQKNCKILSFLIFFKPFWIVCIWPSYNNSLSFPFPAARGRTERRRMSRSAILSHFGQIRSFFQCGAQMNMPIFIFLLPARMDFFLEAQVPASHSREFLKHWARQAHAGALESLVLHFQFCPGALRNLLQ
jgi:hypothetical protein